MLKSFILYCLFGVTGIMIEVFFTGVRNLYRKNWDARGETYLWMIPVYMFAALIMSRLSEVMSGAFFVSRAMVYVLVIYAVEALSGLILLWVIRSIPWNYGQSYWTPKGLINLKYLPFWFIVALGFEPLQIFFTVMVQGF